MCVLYFCCPWKNTEGNYWCQIRYLLLNISHHMEQVLPEACLGEFQVIVRPYVQFIQRPDFPSNVPRCCQVCVSRTRNKSPNLSSGQRDTLDLTGRTCCLHPLLHSQTSYLLQGYLFEKLRDKGLVSFKKIKEQAQQFMESFMQLLGQRFNFTYVLINVTAVLYVGIIL